MLPGDRVIASEFIHMENVNPSGQLAGIPKQSLAVAIDKRYTIINCDITENHSTKLSSCTAAMNVNNS